MYEDIKSKAMPFVYGPFDKESIDHIDYYLTPLNYPGKIDVGMVKLGAKCSLKNGERYGNIIEIPFNTLKSLVQRAEEGV